METIARHGGSGMILGKFMPPHAGHQYLVHFARNFVDRLTVLVCSLKSEPIAGELRYAWMRELFPDVRMVHIAEELPQTPAEHPEFWTIWRRVVGDAVGEPIDYVFASEDYGHRLAAELGATFVPVDLARTHVPISATQIRQQPLTHWQFLPPCVRPYYVRRVCLFGPESTGKSVLAARLAKHFQTVHVPEFARAWLDPRQGVCEAEDIPLIARGQLAAEDALARQAHRLLICDTDVLLTTVWSEVLFGGCPPQVRQLAQERRYDLYLLLDIDAPWIDDTTRYLPHRRQEFFDRCRQSLIKENRPHVLIRGSWEERFSQCCNAISAMLADANG